MNKMNFSRIAAASAIVLAAVLGGATQAQAASIGPQPQAVTSCGSTVEVCRVTIPNAGGFVAMSTYFPGVTGGSARWTLTLNGTTLCSGTMGYQDSRSCNSSVGGTEVFTFYKGQGTSGNVSAN